MSFLSGSHSLFPLSSIFHLLTSLHCVHLLSRYGFGPFYWLLVFLIYFSITAYHISSTLRCTACWSLLAHLHDYIRFLLEYARHMITLGHYAFIDWNRARRKWRITAQWFGSHYRLHWHRSLGSLGAQSGIAHCTVNTDAATGDADVLFQPTTQEALNDMILKTVHIKSS